MPKKKQQNIEDYPTANGLRVEILNPLPPIGAEITLWEEEIYPSNSESYFKRQMKGRKLLAPYGGTGGIKVYQVVGYTLGIGEPLHPRNQMRIRQVEPVPARDINYSIPTIWIAAGATKVMPPDAEKKMERYKNGKNLFLYREKQE